MASRSEMGSVKVSEDARRRRLVEALFPWPFENNGAAFVDWALRDDDLHINQDAEWRMPRWRARQLLHAVNALLVDQPLRTPKDDS